MKNDATKAGEPGAIRSTMMTAGLVLIVLTMVIPIPATLLDVGIAISIASATMILVMAATVDKPTDFQAFPVMLLISLIIRLSLKVSSTRLILTHGQEGHDSAGQVINAFGELMMGGNFIIGVNTDGGAVPDHDRFIECLKAGFDEVLALAGADDEVRISARSSVG